MFTQGELTKEKQTSMMILFRLKLLTPPLKPHVYILKPFPLYRTCDNVVSSTAIDLAHAHTTVILHIYSTCVSQYH